MTPKQQGSGMGIYDRDWWRRPENEQADAVKNATYNPKAFRGGAKNTNGPKTVTPAPSGPPDLPGSDWHWTLKLLAFGWCVVLLYMLYKWAGGRPL